MMKKHSHTKKRCGFFIITVHLAPSQVDDEDEAKRIADEEAAAEARREKDPIYIEYGMVAKKRKERSMMQKIKSKIPLTSVWWRDISSTYTVSSTNTISSTNTTSSTNTRPTHSSPSSSPSSRQAKVF